MCRPEHFTVSYSINPWMEPTRPTDTTKAVAQWQRLHDLYLELGHEVELIDPLPEYPDMVYTANGGFLIDGRPVTLVRHLPPKQPVTRRSNSGSRRVENIEAKVAAPSRIWVEGVHDAAIVEKVWGHDLRVEGVVVEYLEGLDNLESRLAEFGPGPGRRVGVLADHLVTGSKESRLTESVGEHVLVTGHPFIDIWAAVKPERVGLKAWPEVPYGEDWKTGVCDRLGWGEPRDGWRRVYGAVNSFRDLEPTLIGAVERLVDFVTEPHLG